MDTISKLTRALVLLLLIGSTTSFVACVQNVTTPELPFAEQLVISGFLYADSSTVSVSVSRSLPLNVQYSYAEASVRDAQVSISTPQGDVALKYDSAQYAYVAPLQVSVGASYSLHVQWKGHNATALTSIPAKPEYKNFEATKTVTSDRGKRVRVEYNAYFPINEKVSYSIATSAYVVRLADSTVADTVPAPYRGLPNFRNVIGGSRTQSSDTAALVNGSVRQGGGPGSSDGGSLDSAVYMIAKFNSLDPTYYDFWKTFRNTRNVSILGSFGTNPLYNVKGDAIGVFIGVSPSTGWKWTKIQ